MINLYRVLGINSNASDAEIKSAYRKKVKEHHPDLNKNNCDVNNESIKLIIEAYSVLKNPFKKDSYDKKLNEYYNSIKEETEECLENNSNETLSKFDIIIDKSVDIVNIISKVIVACITVYFIYTNIICTSTSITEIIGNLLLYTFVGWIGVVLIYAFIMAYLYIPIYCILSVIKDVGFYLKNRSLNDFNEITVIKVLIVLGQILGFIAGYEMHIFFGFLYSVLCMVGGFVIGGMITLVVGDIIRKFAI